MSGVLFLDAGNVGAGDLTVDKLRMRYDVGPGLRYNTPIGPIRIDLGWQLTPIDGLRMDGHPATRPWRLHLSIGQAF